MPAAEAVETLDGWYCLHDFRSVNWSAWKKASEDERKQAIQELNQLMGDWEGVEKERTEASVFIPLLVKKLIYSS